MWAAQSVSLPWRTLVSAGILRNVFRSPLQPGFARHYSELASASLRKQLRNPRPVAYSAFCRHDSSFAKPISKSGQTAATEVEAVSPRIAAETAPVSSGSEAQKSDTPAYKITFTCKPCQTRSTHKISKQGYHNGTILITCPDCKNRHLICDHLKIFKDQSTTIEDILKEKGEHIRHGTLGTEGDIEIWDDGTTSERTSMKESLETARI